MTEIIKKIIAYALIAVCISYTILYAFGVDIFELF